MSLNTATTILSRVSNVNVLIVVSFRLLSLELGEEDKGETPRLSKSHRILQFLKDAYVKDDKVERFPIETCGWRSLVQIAEGLGLPSKSFYGKKPREIRSDIQDLIKDRLIEVRYFLGERGRGGEIMRFRIALPFHVNFKDKPVENALPISTGIEDMDEILGGGYSERSSIMISGPPGIGKESLGYFFLKSGLAQGDFCLYVTHRPVVDVIKNMRAFGINTEGTPEFIASSGSARRCDLNDPHSISDEIRDAIQRNEDRRIRIVTDVLSPLLVMNSAESMYRYWTQLVEEIKCHDAVFMAYVDEAMHVPSALASMEQLFDSVVVFRIYEQGLLLTPILRIKKMLGLPPVNAYFKYTFDSSRMEIVAFVSG
jgi:KaiC/GvpD/RAD55 family RecA-like ATPase